MEQITKEVIFLSHKYNTSVPHILNTLRIKSKFGRLPKFKNVIYLVTCHTLISLLNKYKSKIRLSF